MSFPDLLVRLRRHRSCRIAYRDMQADTHPDWNLVSDPDNLKRNYANRATGAQVDGLRTTGDAANVRGYLTAGELAIPLADYVHALAGWKAGNYGTEQDTLTRRPDYLGIRDQLYNAVSNVITTQSDTFAAYIRVQLGDSAGDLAWYYLAVYDRSGRIRDDDADEDDNKPALLLFKQVR